MTIRNQRIDIENSFEILKQHFRQLYYCKLRGNKLVCNFFRTCMVLHNLASIEDNDFVYEIGSPDNMDQPLGGQNANGNMLRDVTCLHLFANN